MKTTSVPTTAARNIYNSKRAPAEADAPVHGYPELASGAQRLHSFIFDMASLAACSEPYCPIMLNFSVSVGGVVETEHVFFVLSNMT